ncbi:HAD-IA family hydrolase [Allohahella marinimesophila]|uniref:N-acetylmuramic acid 6-phosphate phosphatase MupP n=1 Tax=Allohahella marinimesophila TaxID=1054972 RepID=A0ABP7NM53_9GAMM
MSETSTRLKQTPAAVLFDLDGCLIDTAPDFHRVVNLQRERYQRAPLDYSQVRPVVSSGARALIGLSFGIDDSHHSYSEKRQELLDLYLEFIRVDSQLFEGLEAVIESIERKGIKWGIVTNKPRVYAEALLKAMEQDIQCGVLVCPDDVSRTKPDPEPLFLASQLLGVEPSACWYLGDHVRDIQAGNAAGMLTIATAYGYVDAGEDPAAWDADLCIHTPDELLGFLEALPHESGAPH